MVNTRNRARTALIHPRPATLRLPWRIGIDRYLFVDDGHFKGAPGIIPVQWSKLREIKQAFGIRLRVSHPSP